MSLGSLKRGYARLATRYGDIRERPADWERESRISLTLNPGYWRLAAGPEKSVHAPGRATLPRQPASPPRLRKAKRMGYDAAGRNAGWPC
jgi:hypothetical protein